MSCLEAGSPDCARNLRGMRCDGCAGKEERTESSQKLDTSAGASRIFNQAPKNVFLGSKRITEKTHKHDKLRKRGLLYPVFTSFINDMLMLVAIGLGAFKGCLCKSFPQNVSLLCLVAIGFNIQLFHLPNSLINHQTPEARSHSSCLNEISSFT